MSRVTRPDYPVALSIFAFIFFILILLIVLDKDEKDEPGCFEDEVTIISRYPSETFCYPFDNLDQKELRKKNE